MSKWLRWTPVVRQWNCRTLSIAAEASAGSKEATDQLLEESHAYSFKPVTGKGNNWHYKSELSALATRLGHEVKALPSLVKALYQVGKPEAVNRLTVLGRSTLMHYVNEHLYYTYPEMEGSMLIDIAKAITNKNAIAKVADHFGASDLVKTKVKVEPNPVTSVYINSQSFCAIVGAVYHDQGPTAAKKFVHDLVIPQLAAQDLQEVVKLQHPRFMLNRILSSQGRPKPVSRLISESGRATHFPSFVVGIFSGDTCLGEGTGTSLRRAEMEAMLTALRTHFQKELSASPLPSDHEEFVTESELRNSRD